MSCHYDRNKRNTQHAKEIWVSSLSLASIGVGALEILHVPSSGWMTGARATCLGNIILIIWHFRPNLLGVAKREIITGACKYVQTFGIFVTKSSRCCIKGNPSYRRQDEWLLVEIRMLETFWGGKDLLKVPSWVAKLYFRQQTKFSWPFKSCFDSSQDWSFLGVETPPVCEKMDLSGIMSWSSASDNVPDPMVIMDWLLSVAQVSRCPGVPVSAGII